MIEALWIWTNDDERQWQTCQPGVDMIFSAWCDIATEAVCADAPMMAVFPQTTNPQAWFRAHLESYRPVFCGSPQDQNNADAARRVGFAHISAHVLPSWYVGLYILFADDY